MIDTRWSEALIDLVGLSIGDNLLESSNSFNMPVLLIDPVVITDVAGVLKEGSSAGGIDILLDITAVDYQEHTESHPHRFAVIWHFLDLSGGRRIRVKAYVPEGASVPTLSGLFPAANWAEREVFDMMGIQFDGHPNLQRILMPDDYEGHPQRKDFPIEGPERAKSRRGEHLGNKHMISWKEIHDL